MSQPDFTFHPSFQTVSTDADLHARILRAFECESEQDGAEGQPLSFKMSALLEGLEDFTTVLQPSPPPLLPQLSTFDFAFPSPSPSYSPLKISPTLRVSKTPSFSKPFPCPSTCPDVAAGTRIHSGVLEGKVEKKSRQKIQSQKRARKKRRTHARAASQEDRCLPDFFKIPRCSMSQHIPQPKVVKTELDPKALPVAQHCWVGRRVPAIQDKAWTYDELIGEGFRLVKWDGREPLIIEDKDRRAIVVFAGVPQNKEEWTTITKKAAETMASVRDEGFALNALPVGVQSHRRGEFVALPVGVSHGNGRLQPGNLLQPPERKKLVQRLLEDESIQRIAGFQSSVFSYYAPKLYAHFCHRLLRLFEQDTSLNGNFANSIFPAASFNLGPRTVSLDHTDAGNVGYGLCALVSLGDFDSRRGGHLVLFDMGLMVEFPPSTVALLPSGILRHGNTAIQPGEERYSIAQYCAGGLIRWVDYGFKTAVSATARMSKTRAQGVLAALNGNHEERVDEALGLFSKVGELESDRTTTFQGYASFLRSNQP